MQAEILMKREERESRTKSSGGGVMAMKAVCLLVLMWDFMVRVLELAVLCLSAYQDSKVHCFLGLHKNSTC